jgi:DNA-binding response OmpR family regulator
MLELFQTILLEEGYEVSLYLYQVNGLAEIERINPDVIILDYQIGHAANGWALLENLKSNGHTAEIPIIVCTVVTHMLTHIRKETLAQKVVIIAKPFNIDDLLSAVKEAVRTANT